MLAAQRRAKVLEQVRLEGAASLRDISRRLGISLSTARRDVDALVGAGRLARTRGGVMLLDLPTTFEPAREVAAATAPAAKAAIGAAAAARIEPGASVLLDSGTTTLAAARAALERGVPFLCVTNDLGIARLLGTAPGVEVVVLGGTLRPGSDTLLGPPGREVLAGLSVDLAMIGAHALGPRGFSDTALDLAATKRAMLAAARRTLLLADGSKVGRRAFCEIAGYGELDALVTDREPPPWLHEALGPCEVVMAKADPA